MCLCPSHLATTPSCTTSLNRNPIHVTISGHSLGGAVAALCMLKLLSHMEKAANVAMCITFACPVLGNQEASLAVRRNGWSHLFQNFILPGVIPALGRGQGSAEARTL